MAEVVISAVVRKLGSIAGDLLVKEGNRFSRFKHDIIWIENEMRHIRFYLEDIDTKQSRSKPLAGLIWDLAYDVDDIINKYFPKLIPRENNEGNKILDWLKRATWKVKNYKAVHDFAVEIEHIKSRVEDINRIRQAYGIKERSGEEKRGTVDPRQSYPHLVEVNVVGFSAHIRGLISQVEDPCQNVISITGMAGLGKTTLAKIVYSSVQERFECSAWIFVSQQPNIIQLLQEIASQVGMRKEEYKHNVVTNLFKTLTSKRYVIVIDDIWTMEAWNALKVAIPLDFKCGSRIILTSRNKSLLDNIGVGIGGYSPVTELQPLNHEDSTKLFNILTATPESDDGSIESFWLESIREKILDKCCGVPLAIVVTLGVLLQKERSEKAWRLVLEIMGQGKDGFSAILALSYNDLPAYLKPCFLYVGLYPEDYEISTFELINLWVAEGFLESGGVKEIEDVGYDYLNHLIARNLIQVCKVGLNGKVKSCLIHDILHNLCIKMAHEINFFTSGNVTDYIVAQKLRRLTTHRDNFANYATTKLCTPKIRSVLSFNGDLEKVKQNWVTDFLISFQFLHVLRIRCDGLPERLPHAISNLSQLSYLGWGSETSLYNAKLPKSISKLRCLLTLDLRDCWSVLLPNVIWTMDQLRHILLPPRSSFSPDTSHPFEASLPNLQTLHLLDGLGVDPNLLGKLTSLRTLRLGNISRRMYAALSDLIPISLKLEKLWLSGGISVSHFDLSRYEGLSILHLHGIRSKSEYKFPSNLIKLCLKGTQLDEKQLETLKKHPNLKLLNLGPGSYSGKEIVCLKEPTNFPELQVLNIVPSKHLACIRIENEGMPKLEEFSMSSQIEEIIVPQRIGINLCIKIPSDESGYQELRSLKELTTPR